MMRTTPVVSIMIPVFNREKTIAVAINSCLAQTYVGVEVVVFDDGSTDNTARIVADIGKRDGRVVLHCGRANGGVAHARNACLRYASGDILALLDSDDTDDPSRIKKSVETMDRGGFNLVSCGGRTFRENGQVVDSMSRMDPDRMMRGDMSAIPFCASIVFHRSLQEAAGGYNEGLGCGEDLDLIARMLLAGAKYGHVNEILYHYHRHANQITKKFKPENHREFTAARVKKYLPKWEALGAV